MTSRYRSTYPVAIQLESRRRALLDELARRHASEATHGSRPAPRRRLRALLAGGSS